ncbi:MAG TPA: PorP/SprF family type IX secretion system membrane protein [Ferruginibacter sp.]|nr:PorP/SprF family type IX secretion system membrane protein [Ferruginibacter sp.]
MRKLIVFTSALLLTLSVSAQDPHFSQFFASPLTLNPAFTGKFSGSWRLAANHRDQWPSIPKAYVTTSASIDFPILKSRIPENDVFGVGISGLTDASANNILKLNYGSVSMSYHKALDENGYSTIGAGFQATYSSLNLDVSKLTFEDMLTQNGFTGTTSDIITNGSNQSYFDINAGLLYSGSTNGQNNFYLGASMYHINRPKVGFKDKNWYLSGRISIHGGGSFPLSDLLTVHTSLIHQMQNKASETTVGAALAVNLNPGEETANSSIYIGSWVRFNDAIVPYIGLEFGGLRIGASYDFNISSLKAATASRGGSEFSVIFIKRPAEYKGIPCPKF